MTAGCSVGSADGLAAVVSGCVGWDGALLDEEDVVLVNVAVATEDDFVPFPALSVPVSYTHLTLPTILLV